MSRSIWLVLLGCLFHAHAVTPVVADEPEPGRQVEQSFQSPADPATKLGYLIYLPEDNTAASGDKKLPLLLFLHGSGERGSNLSLVKKHGPPKLIDSGTRLPFVVVSPQCPAEQRWDAKTLLALLDHVAMKHPVDKDRVYVTGLSMGGSGTWSLIAAEPDRFAAAVPICGRGELPAAERAGRLPVWIVVGDKDRAELVANCREMAAAIQSKGGDVKLSIYSNVGHDSWTSTYAMPELYEWMLRHKASDRAVGRR